MSLNLIADQVIRGRIYPALAQHQAVPYTQAWREASPSFKLHGGHALGDCDFSAGDACSLQLPQGEAEI